MRIAYVINSLEGGGAAAPVPAIIDVLTNAGAEVKLFALLRKNGLALPAIERAGLAHSVREGSPNDHVAALRWLDDEISAWGATHLWTSLSRATLLGQLVGLRRGLPVVSWQHNAFLKPWNERLLRWMRNRSVLWVADSQSVRDLTVARLGVPEGRVVTWPIFSADPSAPRARPWCPGETIRVGSLGRLHPAKGYDILIAALARLEAEGFMSPAPFTIAIGGEGAELGALTQAASCLANTRVRFEGFTASPATFLADQHLYVQPSRREGFCIAAHEAMQAGLPVIVSSVGEMPYTVVDGTMGRVVPPLDVPLLADALSAMLRHPERLAKIGQTARDTVLERFPSSRFRAVGTEIVERLLSGRTSA